MKIIVMCSCGNCIELVPTTYGQHADVQDQFKNRFLIDNHYIEIETSPSPSLEDSFVSSLADAEEYEDIVEILEDQLLENLSVDSELKSIRVDCNKCNNYMVLTNFQ